VKRDSASFFGGIIMATVAQTIANRANAQKSTGPRTPEGKAIVAQNAVKHGLLAQGGVIKGEDWGEFELFRGRMREDLGPLGTLEGMLADRVVNLAWRLRRAERLETAALATLEEQHAARTTDKPAGDSPDEREAALARLIVEDFRYGKVLDRLLGYERRIENSLYRTVNELRKQRLLREVEEVSDEVSKEVSSLKCQVSSEDGQLPATPSLLIEHFTLPTAPAVACGVTTNGGESGDELRQTKPVEATGDKWQVTSQEVPEASAAEPATSNVALHTANKSCETKPTEVSSLKFQVSSEESQPASPSGLPTSDSPLHSADTLCETKPNEVTSEKSQVASEPG
jgi:hypothetical protein